MSIDFTCGEYSVSCAIGEQPVVYSTLVERATLHDDLTKGAEGTLLFVAVTKAGDPWPELTVTQRFSPGPEGGFHPGIMLIPEHHLLFIGAGTRLLSYDLDSVRRLWEDQADMGFWHWKRHDDVILMSAELELAAWDVYGRKLWSTFVEPPWYVAVTNGQVELDIMGKLSTFPIATGPK